MHSSMGDAPHARPELQTQHLGMPAEIERHGAFPDAAFIVVMKPGFYVGASLTGELVSEFPAGHGGRGSFCGKSCASERPAVAVRV
jgi:hypothetical protein